MMRRRSAVLGRSGVNLRANIRYFIPQMSSKYMKNKKKRKAPKQEIKEATKKAKRDKVSEK
jgi:hypothetical protein